MRNLIWLVLLFVVAVIAASTLGLNDGLVSLYWGGWRVDLSLNLFVLGLLLTCAALLLFVKTVRSFLTLPERSRQWRGLRRERAAQAALREALAGFFGARYGRAHKAAQRALEIQRDTPVLQTDEEFRSLTLLLAAGSLHRLQDRTRRDETLQLALQASARGTAEAAHLLGAEWALDDRDAEGALEMLAALSPGAARRTQALRLKLQATRMARRPLEALQTCRLLAKHQAFSPVVAQSLLRALAIETLETVHDADQLRRLWAQLDGADRRDAQVAARAARRAVHLDAAEDARQWLRPFWDRMTELDAPDREAVALALIEACKGIGPDWLPRLESAAQALSQDAAVLAAVGAAYAERRLWGKARGLLQQAADAQTLPMSARRAAWRTLADLEREHGDEAAANACERSALALG